MYAKTLQKPVFSEKSEKNALKRQKYALFVQNCGFFGRFKL